MLFLVLFLGFLLLFDYRRKCIWLCLADFLKIRLILATVGEYNFQWWIIKIFGDKPLRPWMIVFFDDKSLQFFLLTKFATFSLLHKELYVLKNHNKKPKQSQIDQKRKRFFVKRSSKTHIKIKKTIFVILVF